MAHDQRARDPHFFLLSQIPWDFNRFQEPATPCALAEGDVRLVVDEMALLKQQFLNSADEQNDMGAFWHRKSRGTPRPDTYLRSATLSPRLDLFFAYQSQGGAVRLARAQERGGRAQA